MKSAVKGIKMQLNSLLRLLAKTFAEEGGHK